MSIHVANNTQKFNKENCIGNDDEATTQSPAQLRRLPHVFCKLLDLPFPAETRVVIEERRDAYAFVIRQPGLQEADVVAEAVEIVPGAMKVILRGANRIRASLTKSPNAEMGINWRARLPPCTIPEAAKATYANGIITITVPKLLSAAQHPPRNSRFAKPPLPAAEHPRNSRCPSQDMKRTLLCLV